MPDFRSRTLHRTIAAAALLMNAAGAAHAQNALGDGRALDRNLQPGSGGLLPGGVRRDPVQEQIRLNNAIINGTATGGRSFRGSLGYTPAGQFSGRTGSDDLYSFQRDAATSALTGLGVRGSDALRYQFGLTTGENVPMFLAQTGIGPGGTLARPSTGASSSSTSALRSTSEFIAMRASNPALVGVRQDEYGAEFTAKASPLLGISWVKTRESPLGAPADGKAAGIAPLTGLEATARTMPGVLDRSQITGLPTRPLDENRPRPESMVYTRILDSVQSDASRPVQTQVPAKPESGAPDAGKTTTEAERPVRDASRTPQSIDEQLEYLRAQLKGQEWRRTPAPDRYAPTPDRQTPQSQPGSETPPEGTSADAPAAPALPSTLIDGLRRTAQKRTEFLSDRAPDVAKVIVPDPKGPVNQSLYGLNMAEGQDMLAAGRYFDAEDRFTRAMAAAPGDPMARVGRIHAQLGAGLFLSAATNYRNLLRDHPEVVAVKYGPAVLPSAERGKVIVEQLREEMADAGSALKRDASLLLAYLGYQNGDEAMVTEGLDALAAQTDLANTPEQTLLQLLRGAWRK